MHRRIDKHSGGDAGQPLVTLPYFLPLLQHKHVSVGTHDHESAHVYFAGLIAEMIIYR